MPVSDYTPTLDDVGLLLIARTVNDVGEETGTFSNPDENGRGGTRPTAQQVLKLIEIAINDVRPEIGEDIPVDLREDAKHLVALRTAMMIEQSYFAAEVAQGRSSFTIFKNDYEADLKNLQGDIQAEESGEDPADQLSPNMPRFSFPKPIDIMNRPF